MQEVLNPLKSVSPVRAIDFSSNAKLEPRSARSDSFKKNGQNIESNKNLNQASKGKSPTNTQTANTQKLTKNTNSADETTNSEVDNFDKTLAKQSSTRKSTDNETAISKKELKEVTKEVLDALIAFIQQTQNSTGATNSRA
jgi:DNA-directed RNA polymerase specialized sigma subunit